MLGSTATQQLFASANSLGLVPQVNAEWNYNSFISPYVTTSYSASQILDSKFNSTASWSVVPSNGGKINGTISQSASGVGVKSIVDTTASALVFTISQKLENNTGSAQGLITSAIKSNFVKVSNSDTSGQFYKLTFFVKSGNLNYTDGIPSIISGSTVSSSVSSAGTASYIYRIVGVGSDGQTLGPDTNNNKDIVVTRTTGTGSVTLSWNKADNSTAYKIYRAIDDFSSTAYRTTTASTRYVDDLSACVSEPYAPATFTANVFVSPRVFAYTSGSTSVPILTFTKVTDAQTGQFKTSESSIQAVPDVWKKVEVWFGTEAESTEQYSNIQLFIDAVAEYENSSVLIDNIQLYQITEHDFFLNEYYPTNSAFLPFRPGEALLNPLLKNSDRVVYNLNSSSITKPATFAIKNPKLYIAKEMLSPQMQIIPSQYDVFNYYISDADERSIQAQYDTYLSVNKIVLKYVNTFNTMVSGSVTIYTGSSSSATVIQLSSSDFNANGITVLYYDGSSWSTTPWSNPPQLTASGTFQNVVSDFRGISFKLDQSTAQPFFSNFATAGDLDKVHILELSPRLELDLSPILQTYSISKELTSPNSNGFPLSYINSNSGRIVFSNIPFYQNSGYGATIFENQSKNATFYGLMRQGVKFNVFLKNASFSNDLTENIPQMLMYSNAWTINDLGDVSVDLFDITKVFGQAKTSTDYSSEKNNLFTIVSTTLNLAGFSDYDYDGLRNVCEGSTTTTSSFWYDNTKTLFENLQELFLTHQIGAFIDEYGIMRFKGIYQIFNQFGSSKFSADFCVTDTPATTSSSISYIANIIPDSFNENVAEKIGKVLVTYKIPKIYRSVDEDLKDGKFGTKAVHNFSTEASSKVWNEENPLGLASFNLTSSVLTSSNFLSYDVDKAFTDQKSSIGNYSGDYVVGSEIIGYDGIEYKFYPSASPSLFVTEVIRQISDVQLGIERAVNHFSNADVTKIEYNPTGRIVNLQRGKYRTPILDHIYYKTVSEVSTQFNFFFYNPALNSLRTATSSKDYNFKAGTGIFLQSDTVGKYVMLQPKTASNIGYNLFSIDFLVPNKGNTTPVIGTAKRYTKNQGTHKKGDVIKDSKGKVVRVPGTTYTDQHNGAIGIFYNMDNSQVRSSDKTKSTYFVEISTSQESTGKRRVFYSLTVYSLDADGTKVVLDSAKLNSVFDNTMHKLSVYTSDNRHMVVAVDQKMVLKIKLDKTSYNYQNVSYNSSFGAYVKANDSGKDQLFSGYIGEVYADRVMPINNRAVPVDEYDINSVYYFTSKSALNNIAVGMPNSNKSYIWQAVPHARGIKFYDFHFGLGPIIPETAEISPVMYGTDATKSSTNSQYKTLDPVNANSITYSDLNASPFRAKFVLCNNMDSLAIISSPSDENFEEISINAKYHVITEDRTLERVVDPNYSNNSIQLQTQWLASEQDAEKLIALLSKSISSFYTDLDVSIFGNPLVQIGDFAQITYKLKRLGYDPADSSVTPVYGLVTSVRQSFAGGVESTQLVLKPITI